MTGTTPAPREGNPTDDDYRHALKRMTGIAMARGARTWVRDSTCDERLSRGARDAIAEAVLDLAAAMGYAMDPEGPDGPA